MSIFTADIIIHCPVDEVFSFISNYENDWKWRSRRIDFLKKDDTDPDVYTIRHNYFPLLNNKKGNIKCQTIKYAKNERVISQFQLGIIHMIDDRQVIAMQDHSTHYHHSLRVESPGVWKIFDQLLSYHLSYSLVKDLQWLKEMMEKLSFSVSAATRSVHDSKDDNENTQLFELI